MPIGCEPFEIKTISQWIHLMCVKPNHQFAGKNSTNCTAVTKTVGLRCFEIASVLITLLEFLVKTSWIEFLSFQNKIKHLLMLYETNTINITTSLDYKNRKNLFKASPQNVFD